ncbi:protein FANTASTIC FOUR 2-like [Senna tora]|uniref:Protein FANTASTIC FOUR 2-like n=1 Tax=Senna tora TaxID=362788 RepID=A0A834W3S7_9FABA|nr:protein FANTASTIC FOUR 2-like [Senna tora]
MSSSSSVCQGLESCVMEAEVVRLKLSPQNQNHYSDSDTHLVVPPPSTNGGWTFLQSLSNPNQTQNKNVYVHPTVKRLCYNLSEKSLEMCTESLGCENGCKSSDDMSALWKWNPSGSSRRFPPLVSSLRDMGGVQVLRPRRQDGRLILEAVTSPLSVFKAERSNGRLTLRLFTTQEEDDNDEIEAEEEEESEAEAEEEENNEDETEMRKLPRPSRCSQNGNRNYSNKQMQLDWEPFCVAT